MEICRGQCAPNRGVNRARRHELQKTGIPTRRKVKGMPRKTTERSQTGLTSLHKNALVPRLLPPSSQRQPLLAVSSSNFTARGSE